MSTLILYFDVKKNKTVNKTENFIHGIFNKYIIETDIIIMKNLYRIDLYFCFENRNPLHH